MTHSTDDDLDALDRDASDGASDEPRSDGIGSRGAPRRPSVRVGRVLAACFVLGWPSYFIGGPMLLTTIHSLQLRLAVSGAPHPPSTRLHRFSWVGVAGNGNHCDFTVGEIRRARASRAEVEAAYEGVTVRLLGGDTARIQVDFGDAMTSAVFDYFTPALTARLESFRSDPQAFTVYMQYFRDTAGDPRCF